MSFIDTPVTVQAPATSANLGPGFDALGIALDFHDRVTGQVTSAGLAFDVRGEGADSVPHDETHLVYRAMKATFDLLGERPKGLSLAFENSIPHGRGLGSSAAAITAGIVLARALVTDGKDRLDDRDLLQLATDLEGHPDNVAPALFGGLNIAWSDGAAVDAVRVDVAAEVTAFIPPEAVSTERARGLLPESVSHSDAAFNTGRAALLVAALLNDPSHLIVATEDRIHQSYRSAAMPESYKLLQQMRAEGIPTVISGAGPTVLAFARGVSDWAPQGWSVRELHVDSSGTRVVS